MYGFPHRERPRQESSTERRRQALTNLSQDQRLANLLTKRMLIRNYNTKTTFNSNPSRRTLTATNVTTRRRTVLKNNRLIVTDSITALIRFSKRLIRSNLNIQVRRTRKSRSRVNKRRTLNTELTDRQAVFTKDRKSSLRTNSVAALVNRRTFNNNQIVGNSLNLLLFNTLRIRKINKMSMLTTLFRKKNLLMNTNRNQPQTIIQAT